MDQVTEAQRAGFRPDIQGLRAVAIVLVVVGHSGLALSGGFVGVDVFFVVSGYVIGRLLLRELGGTGRVGLATFYARRARRLLPSLALVLVVGIIVGILVLNPFVVQPNAFRTARAASVFVANFYVYRHLGYFDAVADGTNPFLHLWSLSVEEQFYLFLPILLFVAWRITGARSGRRRGMAVLVGLGCAVSFWLSWALTSGHSPIDVEAPGRAAFYGAPTRAWELGVGVLLAFAPLGARRLPGLLGAVLGAAGAALVAWSAVRTDPLQPFPGPAAVPSVLGAALLLVAGAQAGPVRWFLSLGPLRWIGDRSYGWYLWHWPMIVFAATLWPGETGPRAAAAVLSLAVAALVFWAFEDRVRRTESLVGLRALALAAVCVLVPLLLATFALAGADRGWGVDEPGAWYDQPWGRDAGCLIINRDMPNDWPEARCTRAPSGSASGGTALVLGDQQAPAMANALLNVAANRDLRVAQWGRAGCPFLAAAPDGYPECERWQRDAMRLVDRLDPDVVVIANRGTAYTVDVDERVGSNAAPLTDVDGRRTTPGPDATRAYGRALRRTLEQLAAKGVAAVVARPVPGYRDGFPVPSVIRPSAEPPVRSTRDVKAERAPVLAAERRAMAGLDHVASFDPLATLCKETCTPFLKGRWTYLGPFDLNVAGVETLQPDVGTAVDQARRGR